MAVVLETKLFVMGNKQLFVIQDRTVIALFLLKALYPVLLKRQSRICGVSCTKTCQIIIKSVS